MFRAPTKPAPGFRSMRWDRKQRSATSLEANTQREKEKERERGREEGKTRTEEM